ncbi:hypothetical protein Cgig2_012159 [Carnegiea gigantea]|uniref:SCP domain-containing protein n=1 Tax=Carnegiea gigantea TaxID=171969 RepID=A0A9Q1QQE0_9CARY|nr:hypothetical protein Cgig2_012159 [Carnegiea gigantea]
MAFPATRTIVLSILLAAVLFPSQASEYRVQRPDNGPEYEDQPSDNGYMPIPAYRPGKALKRSYNDSPYPSTSLAYLFLKGQNAARAAVGLPPFAWDDNLANYAQNWANQRIDDCALIHSDGPYGENIFWGSGDSDWSPEVAVNSWIVERQYYDYYSNSCMGGQDCGHYTQIIWRDSTRIGCAKVPRSILKSGLISLCESQWRPLRSRNRFDMLAMLVNKDMQKSRASTFLGMPKSGHSEPSNLDLTRLVTWL